jgi:hypothetical protein
MKKIIVSLALLELVAFLALDAGPAFAAGSSSFPYEAPPRRARQPLRPTIQRLLRRLQLFLHQRRRDDSRRLAVCGSGTVVC